MPVPALSYFAARAVLSSAVYPNIRFMPVPALPMYALSDLHTASYHNIEELIASGACSGPGVQGRTPCWKCQTQMRPSSHVLQLHALFYVRVQRLYDYGTAASIRRDMHESMRITR